MLMGKAIEVTRMELSATALRELAAGTRDGALGRRLLPVAVVLEGHSRAQAAQLNDEQMEEWRRLVLDGPDAERNQVIRWRCADLRQEIAARWSVTLHERSVGRLVHRLDMTRLQPRPYHPKKDAAAQEAFKKTSATWERAHRREWA